MNAITHEHISAMSYAEKVQAMEMLWVAMRHDMEQSSSPAWHQAVIDQRLAKIEAGTAEYLSLDAVKKRFNQ